MTSQLVHQDQDQWRAYAEIAALERNNVHTPLTAGCIGAGLGFAFGGPFVGGAILAWTLWKVWQGYRADLALEPFLEQGRYDKVLPPDERKIWARQQLESRQAAPAIDTTAVEYNPFSAEDLNPEATPSLEQEPLTQEDWETEVGTQLEPEPEPEPIAAQPVPELQALPNAPQCSAHWNEKQKYLWAKIQSDCPELCYAIFGKVLVVSGPQQTGKSSLASAIAFIRKILLGESTIAVTPHVDGAKIFQGRIVGHGGNFDQIQVWYDRLTSDFSMDSDRQTLVVDELTQYANGHEKLGQAIVRTAISESDKHGYSPVLINHARTVSAGFAGIKGMKALIESSAVQVTRQYQLSDHGAMQRSPTITISLPGKLPTTFMLPKWCYTPILKKHFSEFCVQQASPSRDTFEPQTPTQPQQSTDQFDPSLLSDNLDDERNQYERQLVKRLQRIKQVHPKWSKAQCCAHLTGSTSTANKGNRRLAKLWDGKPQQTNSEGKI